MNNMEENVTHMESEFLYVDLDFNEQAQGHELLRSDLILQSYVDEEFECQFNEVLDLLEDTGVFASPMVMNAANHEDLSAMGKAKTRKRTYSKPTVKMNHELVDVWRLLSANLMLRYWISLMNFLLQQSNSFGVYCQVFDTGGQLSRSMTYLLMEPGYGRQGYFDVHG